jgi:hypothetical protein
MVRAGVRLVSHMFPSHDKLALAGPAQRHKGSAKACELQWGSPGAYQRAAQLAGTNLDWLIACDTCYLDPVRHLKLVAFLLTLSLPGTRCSGAL